MVRKGRCGAAGGRTSGRQRGPVPEDDVVNLDHVRVLQLDGNVQLSLERVLPCGVHCKQREWLSQKMRSATQTRRQDLLQYEAWYVSCLSRTLPRPVHRLDRDLPAVRCVNGCVDTDAARTLAQLWTVQQLCSSQITTRTRSASKQGCHTTALSNKHHRRASSVDLTVLPDAEPRLHPPPSRESSHTAPPVHKLSFPQSR
jgi:hypothetical protein